MDGIGTVARRRDSLLTFDVTYGAAGDAVVLGVDGSVGMSGGWPMVIML